ncbi:MAG: hypothetical protein MUD17_09105 [Gemmatimonadaceae bacterium]|jgi:hypothetical protein|nr:hypothetical protein [Gemmatimonadaceae bacterium]
MAAAPPIPTIQRSRARTLFVQLWAAPTSLLGLLVSLVVLASGGSVRRVAHTLEVALQPRRLSRTSWWHRSRFGAITLGHVIIGRTHAELARVRAHERVHVQQAERLGPFFLPAYALASAAAWWRGDCPYRGNRYEVEAYAVDDPSARYHAEKARRTAAGEAIQSPNDSGTRHSATS